MQSAASHNELERLRAVRSVYVPGSGRIAGLQAFTRAAASACGTGMAAITLVEETKVVLLAAHGVAMPALQRPGSFCAHAIGQIDVVEVPDALLDPRFASEELVLAPPHVRFYAAAQLVDHAGMCLGTLCVLDCAPSSLTEPQRTQLRMLADGVVEILESHRTQSVAQPSNQNALRTLAAGVGHEINNPLSFVATNLDFAVDELRLIATSHPLLAPTIEEIVVSIVEAKDGAQRIRKIVRGLQSFANQEMPKRPTSVENALESAAAMALKEVRPRATLDVHVEVVPPVLADDGGLTHVVVNLLVNAAQAFADPDPSRNRITLQAFVRPQPSQREVAITVSDNGPGIAPEVLPRIFDPFFTTKPVGHGSGLGLSLCHTIVSSLGGQLLCETELGRGTTFTVILPVAQVRHQSSELPRSGTSPVARGRILLIDDEESLLRAMTRLLRPDHEVVAVSDARAALAMLVGDGADGAQGADFDIVFCDLMMPQLSGMDLFAQVARSRPDVAERFVFMTAGAISERAREFLSASRNPCVEKPFSSQVLRALAQKLVRKFSARPSSRSGAGTD